MIIIRSRFLKTGEVWFDDKPTEDKVDILLFRQQTSPIAGAECTPFFTILIDLTKTPDDLFISFSKDTRYEIRRAETKDSLFCLHYDENTGEILPQFISFFHQFALSKSIPLANEQMLWALTNAKALALSCCKKEEPLVWHAYYISSKRVRLLYSASLFRTSLNSGYRNMIGRANRFLHWQDMLHFKQMGIATYDMGGWYEGKTDEEKLRINKFKEEFGGTIVKEFNCEKLVTWKARLVNAVAKYYHKQA